MSEQHYHGGCQCGAVKFEVDVDLDKTFTCNCSRCQKIGSVLAFTPATNFKLLSGDNAQTEYLFNKNHIHHLFCKTCGVQSFSRAIGRDGTPTIAVNANCLEGVNPRELKSRAVDGRKY